MSDSNKPDNSAAIAAAVLGGLALVGGAVAVFSGDKKKQPALRGTASASGGLGRRSAPGRFAKGCGCGGR